jgi:hypothetical protein
VALRQSEKRLAEPSQQQPISVARHPFGPSKMAIERSTRAIRIKMDHQQSSCGGIFFANVFKRRRHVGERL